MLHALLREKSYDPRVSIYPKEIPFSEFDWKNSKFYCYCCLSDKKAFTFAIYECYHVLCDHCIRQSPALKCG